MKIISVTVTVETSEADKGINLRALFPKGLWADPSIKKVVITKE